MVTERVGELQASGQVSKNIQVYLLEFDHRFELFEGFIHYDFKSPLRLPAGFKGKFDRVILDPPFLSNDCQTKSMHLFSFFTPSLDPGVLIISGTV